MIRNGLERFLQSVIVLLGCALMVLIMLRIIPGNPVAVLMGEHVDTAVIERLTAEMGLDQPVHVQFVRYLAGAVRGDFGTSYTLGKPVSSLLASAFVNTLILALLAALFAWTLGLVSGLIAAVKRNSILDRLFMGTSLLGVSMPVFMAAMLLQYFLAFRLKWLPIAGTDSLAGFILPAVALGWNSAGSVARLVRSTLLEILEEDYIDTARAKGRGQMGVLIVHAFKNALLPVVTMMAIQFSGLLSGAVITETVFSINGIGRLAVQAINGRDVPLLQGTVLFAAAIVVFGNYLSDLLCGILDPRIRREA